MKDSPELITQVAAEWAGCRVLAVPGDEERLIGVPVHVPANDILLP